MDALKFHTNTAMSLAHAAGTDNNTSTGISDVAQGIDVVVDITSPNDSTPQRLRVNAVGYNASTSELTILAPLMRPHVPAVVVPVACALGAVVGSLVTGAVWAVIGG
ncbi:hypothetical protein CMP1-54 [Clavibacter phage CMP1]|uniref:Uncharacterized protein n=1 Tax=Clavibacter phage CMP1 TaxID=686439 RepID=D0U238_9CAUD|nr:hypothetical protein CMP1-54 [Clavibacter phage CMP1]ACY35949.1 hypothetical protein CMP1-54 [Clavibacter phage CMP1]